LRKNRHLCAPSARMISLWKSIYERGSRKKTGPKTPTRNDPDRALPNGSASSHPTSSVSQPHQLPPPPSPRLRPEDPIWTEIRLPLVSKQAVMAHGYDFEEVPGALIIKNVLGEDEVDSLVDLTELLRKAKADDEDEPVEVADEPVDVFVDADEESVHDYMIRHDISIRHRLRRSLSAHELRPNHSVLHSKLLPSRQSSTDPRNLDYISTAALPFSLDISPPPSPTESTVRFRGYPKPPGTVAGSVAPMIGAGIATGKRVTFD
jgi:hypothetical protein